MKRPTVNLRDVFMVERIGPNHSEHHFNLKFYGKTPGGRDLEVIVDFPAWGVQELANKLWEVQKEHERQTGHGREALKGE